MDNLNEWLEQIEAATNLSTEDVGKITGAGAEAYSEVLKEHTPVSSVDYSKGGKTTGHASKRKTKHLKDAITFKDGHTADGVYNGNTDVGFESQYYDFVARIVNNGKKKMSAKEAQNLHFVDKATEDAKEKVFEAEKEAYLKLTKGGE